MRNHFGLIGVIAVVLAIGLASMAEASPTATPAAHTPQAGKGRSTGGLFDDMVGGHRNKQATEANGATPKPVRRHLTAAEWRGALSPGTAMTCRRSRTLVISAPNRSLCMLFVSNITNSNTTHVFGSIDEFCIRAQIYFR